MLRILKNLERGEWFLFAISLMFISAQVWLDLELPGYMSEITRLVQTPGSELREILTAGTWMLLCALGSVATSIVVAGIAARIASGLSARLRAKLFDKVQSFSMEEISSFSTPSLITRSTNDITQVQMLIVIGLQMLVKAPILAVWAILKITGKSWQWSLATGVSVGLLVLLVAVSIALALPKFTKLQKLTDNLNRASRENLNGLQVIRAYNAERYQEAKFAAVNDEVTRTNLFANNVMTTLMPSISLIMSGLSLSIYWIGALLIQAADVPARLGLFSDMIVFSSYAMQVVMAFMMLIVIFILLPRAQVSAVRIQEVLETAPRLKNGPVTRFPADSETELEFREVSFKYPGAEEEVLRNISFTVKRGETVAFIGSTGCGKSTLINLIPRFYDATGGEVLIKGINVKEYDQQMLRSIMGYVSQKAVLFGGTVASNIAFGGKGSGSGEILSSDITDAAYTSQASEFVDKLEGGYDAHIAQGGSNLSGGQKQRLSIARAIARRPELLIFDDSFSALDYKTDRKLRSGLKKDARSATKLIVAQRIGTIKDADTIIVLEEGRIAGKGTHDELMQTCPVYQEIAYSQLTKEELA
ncbi:ABC transporter ATP-binding protein [Paenibacillus piscarius]|uniref:ABC transporter ATP-binding protein n=1 Tax=Paenibacillus piscarius TaxID=1089681 RepID=UPI001EE83DD7|nr:ABC transporter ATP-binding protein [Paenibacillus piscarius]